MKPLKAIAALNQHKSRKAEQDGKADDPAAPDNMGEKNWGMFAHSRWRCLEDSTFAEGFCLRRQQIWLYGNDATAIAPTGSVPVDDVRAEVRVPVLIV